MGDLIQLRTENFFFIYEGSPILTVLVPVSESCVTLQSRKVAPALLHSLRWQKRGQNAYPYAENSKFSET